MPEIRTFWNGFADDVFGPQPGPTEATTDSGIYPVCQRQQQRIFSLENILYGLEFVITPLLQQIQAAGAVNQLDSTDKLTLTGAADHLNSYGGSGTFFKVSIYNLSTNNNVTINTAGSGDFILEPGVSMDINCVDPTTITATGTAGNVIQLIYSAKQ